MSCLLPWRVLRGVIELLATGSPVGRRSRVRCNRVPRKFAHRCLFAIGEVGGSIRSSREMLDGESPSSRAGSSSVMGK